MPERTSRAKLFAVVIRFFDHPIESRDRVLDDGRKVFGEYAIRTWLQSEVALVDKQDARAAVSRLGSPQLAQDPLDLVLLRQRDRHIETQPDNVTIQILSRQQRAQLVHVATPKVEPLPEPDPLRFDPWTHSVPE